MTPVRTFKDSSGSLYDVAESDLAEFKAAASPDVEEVETWRGKDGATYDVPLSARGEFMKAGGAEAEKVYSFKDESGGLLDVPHSQAGEFAASAGMKTFSHPYYAAAPDNGFEARKATTDRFKATVGRDPTEAERADIYYYDAIIRGDTETAKKLSRSRSALDVANRDSETAAAEVAAVRAPYLAVRGTLGGVTLGASDVILDKIERSGGDPAIEAQSSGEAMGENIGRLLGSIFTGGGLAGGTAKAATTGKLVTSKALSGGLSALVARTGASKFAQTVAARTATSLATMAPQAAAAVATGKQEPADAVRDTAINALGAIVGIGPEVFVKPGAANFLAQVFGQAAYDAAMDAAVTGRLTRDNLQEWMINELPNLATATIFGARDWADKDFGPQQKALRKDAVRLFAGRARAEAATPRPPAPPPPAADMVAVSERLAAENKPRYDLNTRESVDAAIADLNLREELSALRDELTTIKTELANGDRIAGRYPVKNERGEIIDWRNAGAAYPGGLGADTIPALRNYLDGKPLTENQERQLAAAVKYSLEKLSGEAGFDVAAQEPILAEALTVGDQVTMAGEKFTVKDLDADTGDITLKDGRLVTVKAGETLLADKGSHVSEQGATRTDPTAEEFDPDAFLEAEPDAIPKPEEPTPPAAPVRHDIGNGLTAEKQADGSWQVSDANGNKGILDPANAVDREIMGEIDPDARVEEVKRIAQDAASKLPGANLHFVDSDADLDQLRASLGDQGHKLKAIRAEDGTTRGFAIVGTPDYYLLTKGMKPEDAGRTVLHEAVGHLGVREVLGPRFDGVMDNIAGRDLHLKIRRKVIADYPDIDPRTQEGRREMAEETLAYLSENRQNYPNTWKRLVARIKDIFRELGFEWAKDWTEDDVAALIARAHDRMTRPRSAVLKTAQNGVRRAMTYASGRWEDAVRSAKVFDDGQRRVYEANRQGKTIYETQVKRAGKWDTVMYSDNLPEAREASYNRAGVSGEESAREIYRMSISEPWYARARAAGLSDAQIFAPHREIIRLLQAGKLQSVDRPAVDSGSTPPGMETDLPMAADTGIRFARSQNSNPLKLLTSSKDLNEVRAAKDEWAKQGKTQEGAQKIIHKFYRPENYSQLRNQSPVLVTVPSTSGSNLIPIELANRLARDYSGEHFDKQLAVSGAQKESKHKNGFWAKLEDPVVYHANEPAIFELLQHLNGRPVWIVEDVHNTGESWMRFKALLEANGANVSGVVTLAASDFRLASSRDVERLASKLSQAVNMPIDEVRRVVHDNFHGSSKQWFNYAERAASGSNKQAERLWSALGGKLSASTGEGRASGIPDKAISGNERQGGNQGAWTQTELRFRKADLPPSTRRQSIFDKYAKQFYGRPDLAQMGESPRVRALGAEVDQNRNERGEPTPQSFKAWNDGAATRLSKDTTGEWLNFVAGKLHYEGDDAGENTILARKLLEAKGLEAFASGNDDELARIGAAMWGYRTARSNIARALAAGRDMLETPTERARRFIAEALYYPGAQVDRKLQGMDLVQMQAELKKRAGKMQEIRTKLLDMGIDLAKLDERTLNDPAALAEIVRQIQISNAGWGDMAYEFWRNAILSAPPTHVANVLGNTASLTWNYTAQKATEALINALTGSKSGTSFGEIPGMWRALASARHQAARNAMLAFSAEQAVIEGVRLEEKGVAIGGKTGRAVRVPQRALLAADEFSKTMILQAELYSRAYQDAYQKGWRGDGLQRRIREIMADPKSDMVNDAVEETRRLVFQADPGEVTMWLLQARKLPGYGWVAKFALPFVSTPTNILKTGLRKSPLGILRMAKEGMTGGYTGNRKALIHDAAEQILAFAGMAAIASLVYDDDKDGNPRITGSRPSMGNGSAGETQAQNRMFPAQSIRLGGKWYSYSRIEPLATAMTLQVDLWNSIRNRSGEDAAERVSGAWASMKSLVRDKTFTATIGDIIRATEDDSRGMSLIQNFAASWVPNIVRTTARATDPYNRDQKVRQRDDRPVIAELAANIGQAAAPLAALQDAPRTDFWGRPLEKSEGFPYATDVLWRMVSPIQVQTVKTPENFDRLLFNYNRRAKAEGWEDYWPTDPTTSFKLPGPAGKDRQAYMNPEELAVFKRRRGELFMAAAARERWNFDNPGLQDIRAMKRLIGNASEQARQEIAKTHAKPPTWKRYEEWKRDQEGKAFVTNPDREMARQVMNR
jgi:hypothetical protein